MFGEKRLLEIIGEEAPSGSSAVEQKLLKATLRISPRAYRKLTISPSWLLKNLSNDKSARLPVTARIVDVSSRAACSHQARIPSRHSTPYLRRSASRAFLQHRCSSGCPDNKRLKSRTAVRIAEKLRVIQLRTIGIGVGPDDLTNRIT